MHMHGIIHIKNEPVILLSEEAITLFYDSMIEILQEKNIYNKKNLNKFIEELNVFTYEIEPHLVDMKFYLNKENTNELKLLIDLIPEAINRIKESHELEEEQILLDFRNYLIDYLHELESSNKE